MISIDWQQVIGSILIGGSGLGGAIWAAIIGWKKFRTGSPATAERSADAPAPEGAVEWLTDVCKAMGDASAESKLAALIQGATRDQARMLRIAELESLPKAKMTAVAMDLKPRVVQEDTP
jgi:hypothetical protein